MTLVWACKLMNLNSARFSPKKVIHWFRGNIHVLAVKADRSSVVRGILEVCPIDFLELSLRRMMAEENHADEHGRVETEQPKQSGRGVADE